MQDAGVESVRRTENGWQLHRDTGEVVTLQSHGEVRQALVSMGRARSRAEADVLVREAEKIAAQDAAEGVGSEQTFRAGERRFARDSRGNVRVTEHRGGAERVLDVSPQTLANLRAQMDAAGLETGTIRGANYALRDDAGRLVRHYETNAGADVTTILHERFETLYKAGRFTAQEITAAAAHLAALPHFDPATIKDAGQRRVAETLHRMARNDASLTEAARREAFMELAVADVLGRFRDGTAIEPDSIQAGVREAALHAGTGPQRGALESMRRMFAVVRRYLGSLFGLSQSFRDARQSGALTNGDAWDTVVRRLQGESAPAASAKTGDANSINTNPASGAHETGLQNHPSARTVYDHDPYGPKAPRRILRELTGESDAAGNAGTNAQKRRKHGRGLASYAGLVAWAERNGYHFDSAQVSAPETALESASGGGEHKILAGDDGRVYKFTKPGLLGAQAEDAGAYLQRWARHNEIFGDDVQFEGIVTLPGEHAPRVVISQPFYKGRDATAAELADYLTEHGFHQEGDRWVHPVRKLAVWDTITEGNAIMTSEGVRVIDLQIEAARPEEIRAVSERTGIGRDTSFSLGPAVVQRWVDMQTPIPPPPAALLLGRGETALQRKAQKTWAALPASVQTRDGKTVHIKHNKQGTEEVLLEHLTTSHRGSQTYVDAWRVFSLARIADTLQKARFRFVAPNGNHIYIQRYADDRNHYVIVDPGGIVTGQSTDDALWTQWLRKGAGDTYMTVERIEMISPASAQPVQGGAKGTTPTSPGQSNIAPGTPGKPGP